MLKGIFRTLRRMWCCVKLWPTLIMAECEVHKLRKNYGTLYYVCPHGIGDTLFVAALIEEYKLRYHVPRVYLVVRENHADLPDMFSAIDGKIVNNRLVNLLTTYMRVHRIAAQDNLRFGHFILQFGWPEPGQLLGVRGINLLDIYRACVFNLEPGTKLQCPEVYVSPDELDKMIHPYISTPKTILLMPYASTIHKLSQTFWDRLAQECLKRDYIVYTNVKDASEMPIYGTQPLSLPLKELFIVSRTLGWKCISLRSGICDLLGFSDISLFVLYENLPLLAGWGMESLGLPNPNIHDVLLPADLNDSAQLATVFATIIGEST